MFTSHHFSGNHVSPDLLLLQGFVKLKDEAFIHVSYMILWMNEDCMLHWDPFQGDKTPNLIHFYSWIHLNRNCEVSGPSHTSQSHKEYTHYCSLYFTACFSMDLLKVYVLVKLLVLQTPTHQNIFIALFFQSSHGLFALLSWNLAEQQRENMLTSRSTLLIQNIVFLI